MTPTVAPAHDVDHPSLCPSALPRGERGSGSRRRSGRPGRRAPRPRRGVRDPRSPCWCRTGSGSTRSWTIQSPSARARSTRSRHRASGVAAPRWTAEPRPARAFLITSSSRAASASSGSQTSRPRRTGRRRGEPPRPGHVPRHQLPLRPGSARPPLRQLGQQGQVALVGEHRPHRRIEELQAPGPEAAQGLGGRPLVVDLHRGVDAPVAGPQGSRPLPQARVGEDR